MSAPEQQIEIWNRRYTSEGRDNQAKYERWLDRWLDLLGSHRGRALDLGCGPGFDVSLLLGLGLDVTAVDFSATAIELSQDKNPSANHHVSDLRNFARTATGPFEIVVANLSLHYFDRLETEKIFADISRLLAPGGIFAFRVNAYDETGAPIDPESWILTTVDGVPKQFFTANKIADLLAPNLDPIAVEKRTTDRYTRRKSIFEVIARKRTGTTAYARPSLK